MDYSKFLSNEVNEAAEIIYCTTDKKNFTKAIKILEQEILKGDTNANYFLSRCYSWGDAGTTKNRQKAVELLLGGAKNGNPRCILGAIRYNCVKEVKPYMTKSFRQAFDEVEQMAHQDDIYAAYQLGCVYYWGNIIAIEENQKSGKEYDQKAKYWFEVSSRQNHILATLNLANCYLKGRGCLKDDDLALENYKKLFELGFTTVASSIAYICDNKGDYDTAVEYLIRGHKADDICSTEALGYRYEAGIGVTKSYKKAYKYYKIAAEANNAIAQNNLARLYYKGLGVPKDLQTAYLWYRKGASHGNIFAMKALAKMLYFGEGCSRDYKGSATLYYKLVYQYNDSDSCSSLVYAYENGLGVTKSLSNAYIVCKKGYEMGNIWCTSHVAYMLKEGIGCDINYDLALQVYTRLINSGKSDQYGINGLASMYKNGQGVPKSFEKAYELYQKGTDLGYTTCARNLAYLLLQGEGCTKDTDKAIKMYEDLAYNKNDAVSYGMLSELHRDGNGVTKDLQKAYKLCVKAAELEDTWAKKDLEKYDVGLFGVVSYKITNK